MQQDRQLHCTQTAQDPMQFSLCVSGEHHARYPNAVQWKAFAVSLADNFLSQLSPICPCFLDISLSEFVPLSSTLD